MQITKNALLLGLQTLDFPSISLHQKKIVSIAVCALACLALLYVVKRYFCDFKATPTQGGKNSIEAKGDSSPVKPETVLSDDILTESEADEQVDTEVKEEGSPKIKRVDIEIATDAEKKEVQNFPKKTPEKKDRDFDEKLFANPELYHAPAPAPQTPFDGNDESDDTRPLAVKEKFSQLEVEMRSGRKLDTVTKEERKGLSILELCALKAIEVGKNTSRHPLTPSTDGVDESEWDD